MLALLEEIDDLRERILALEEEVDFLTMRSKWLAQAEQRTKEAENTLGRVSAAVASRVRGTVKTAYVTGASRGFALCERDPTMRSHEFLEFITDEADTVAREALAEVLGGIDVVA